MVGNPVHLSGDVSPQAAKTQAFASRYGRLGVDEVVVMTDHEYSVPELGGESLATFHMAEHLRTWVREINRMRARERDRCRGLRARVRARPR